MKYISSIFLTLLLGCSELGNNNYLAHDARIFKGTPLWKVARKLNKTDTTGVLDFFKKHPELLDYQEPKFGFSLLTWAVYADNLKATELLAYLGADPNLPNKKKRTPFIYAADKIVTSEFLKLLLEHGGNINYVVNDIDGNRIGTPLIAASWCRLQSVKILLEKGADVNYVWKYEFKEGKFHKKTALHSAFRGGKMEIIHYLVLEAKADFSEPFLYTIHGDPYYIVDGLRDLTYDLDS